MVVGGGGVGVTVFFHFFLAQKKKVERNHGPLLIDQPLV